MRKILLLFGLLALLLLISCENIPESKLTLNVNSSTCWNETNMTRDSETGEVTCAEDVFTNESPKVFELRTYNLTEIRVYDCDRSCIQVRMFELNISEINIGGAINNVCCRIIEILTNKDNYEQMLNPNHRNHIYETVKGIILSTHKLLNGTYDACYEIIDAIPWHRPLEDCERIGGRIDHPNY